MFDPLGITEVEVKARLGSTVKKCFWNQTSVQSTTDSEACGEYCCYFALVRLYNADLKFAKVLRTTTVLRTNLAPFKYVLLQALNAYFLEDVARNEQAVKRFIATGGDLH